MLIVGGVVTVGGRLAPVATSRLGGGSLTREKAVLLLTGICVRLRFCS